ncbi:MAG: EF-P lysine aminoacylase EpmA [Gammaproteobacteria bacterium]|nr:EF-P lysine aminoacylase EpmA [Gammaproteobacteria bacterium]
MRTSWQPDVSLETLRLRAQWLKQIREFFDSRQVLEVETPVLSPASVPDPNIESLQTRVNQQRQYLQTSPELYMKRLLAAGSGPIYQISRVFRDGEIGRLHNPEFTLVEWYQPGYSQRQLIDEVTELVIGLCGLHHALTPVQLISYSELFQDHAGINPLRQDWAELDRYCQAKQLQCPVDNDDWSVAMDWLLALVIQPAMQGLVFVVDYPAAQASLARLDPDNPAIARRFELFINGVEMANGFEELTDAAQQRQRFMQENRDRKSMGMQEIALDEKFLAALEAGFPETSGVALGLDRLLMWKTGSEKVQEVMSFGYTD